MKKIVKTALTCKVCGYTVEVDGTPDISNMDCATCSTIGEYSIRTFTEREYGIEEANRKIESLKKVNGYINNELLFWEKKLSFLLSNKYDRMILQEREGAEYSELKLACFFEEIDSL